MESKENPTTDALNHEVRPEHFPLRDAMNAWCDAAAEGVTRSVIVLQCEFDKNGEGSASSHVSGQAAHLVQAATACMSAMTPDNPVGAILRNAAIRGLQAAGLISPAAAPKPTQENDETHNNTENHE